MANVTRWDPFSEMLSLRQAMDRLFDDAWVRPVGVLSTPRGEGMTTLAVDLYESGDELVLTASIPGVKPEDLDVTIQGDTLTIKAEATSDETSTEGTYHRRERRTSRYYRQVTLPTAVKADGAQAHFENGVLKLHLPKAEEAKERKIPIGAAAPAQITEGVA